MKQCTAEPIIRFRERKFEIHLNHQNFKQIVFYIPKLISFSNSIFSCKCFKLGAKFFFPLTYYFLGACLFGVSIDGCYNGHTHSQSVVS
jgi:hypothetical protein